MFVISACLAGVCCKYNGGSNETPWVLELMLNHNFLLICPESVGGLPTPRQPSEICGDKVINKSGEDITSAFMKGAFLEIKRMEEAVVDSNEDIEMAILKAKSPSCGCGEIYDGTFTGKVIKGDGIFAKMLMDRGIAVKTEQYNFEK